MTFRHDDTTRNNSQSKKKSEIIIINKKKDKKKERINDKTKSSPRYVAAAALVVVQVTIQISSSSSSFDKKKIPHSTHTHTHRRELKDREKKSTSKEFRVGRARRWRKTGSTMTVAAFWLSTRHKLDTHTHIHTHTFYSCFVFYRSVTREAAPRRVKSSTEDEIVLVVGNTMPLPPLSNQFVCVSLALLFLGWKSSTDSSTRLGIYTPPEGGRERVVGCVCVCSACSRMMKNPRDVSFSHSLTTRLNASQQKVGKFFATKTFALFLKNSSAITE